MIKVYRIILPVNNINNAAEFYSSLLEQQGERVSPGRHYFKCGDVILACYDSKADGDKIEIPPNPEHIYFSVDDLDRIFSKAQKAGFNELDENIEIRPWGERSFYGKDPFGNPLCFVDSKTIFTSNIK